MPKRNKDLLKPGETRYVAKGWGSEKWFCNTTHYCGKLLTINYGKRTSWHYHVVKDETFYVQSGLIVLYYGKADDMSDRKSKTLFPGDTFHVPPGMRHQLCAAQQSEVLEFSTTHSDADSIRVIKGD